jgi:hypothetical protein
VAEEQLATLDALLGLRNPRGHGPRRFAAEIAPAARRTGLMGLFNRLDMRGAQVVRARGQAQAPALVQVQAQAQATGADHPYVKYGGNVAPIPDHTQPDSFWRQVYDRSGATGNTSQRFGKAAV